MHVVRKTDIEMVILDSSIWISIFLLCISVLLMIRVELIHARLTNYLIVGFFLLFVLLFWRREVVVFDRGRQLAEWTRRRLFRVDTGTVPFSDIVGIGMETTTGGRSQTYRLAILTAQNSVPMSDNYSGNLQNYENLRQDILDFLRLDQSGAMSARGSILSSGIDDEVSIRSLLRQGRKIDAIELVRTTQQISLADATDRVSALADEMKAPH